MMGRILPLVAALAVSGCAARERPPSRRASGALPAASSAPDAARLRQALERAVSERAGWDTLRLLVDCHRNSTMTSSVKIFGRGIGIWNDERQFRLDPGQIGSLLRALQGVDFPGMQDTYGGPKSVPTPRPSPGAGGMVTIVTCRIELSLAGYDKQVVQLARGEQSPTLRKLAEDLLGICTPPARLGLTATSLRDGLEKVSREELAPEAWLVVVHRKPRQKGGAEGHPGFLLRVSGYQAATQPYDPVTGYQDPVLLPMGAKEAGTLARELAARDPASWPINLYAADYTDVTIQVLNHEKSVQARQFAGLAPGTHGHHQKAFEEVVEILERLHRDVVDRGQRVPGAEGERAGRLPWPAP